MKNYNNYQECRRFDNLMHCLRCARRAEATGAITNHCHCPAVDEILRLRRRRLRRRHFCRQTLQVALLGLFMGFFTYMLGEALDKTDYIWGYLTAEEYYGTRIMAIADDYDDPSGLTFETEDGSLWKVIGIPETTASVKELIFQTQPGFSWKLIRIPPQKVDDQEVKPGCALVTSL